MAPPSSSNSTRVKAPPRNMYADADVGDKQSSRGFETILVPRPRPPEQQLHGSTILPEPHPSPSQARTAAEQLQLQSYVNRLALALVSSRPPYVKESNDRASASASQIDVADYTNTTTAAAPVALALVSSRTPYVKESNDRASASASQIDVADYTNTTTAAAPAAAYPFFSKQKWKVFWMIAVIAAVMSAFMTTITVVVKQQHKKIEMKELCRDIKLDGLDGDERPDPINTDLVVLVPAAAPVDNAAGAVPSPLAFIPPLCVTAPQGTPSCTNNGVQCGNSNSQCTQPPGTLCCSCKATNCATTGNDWYCTANVDDKSQCPTPAPATLPPTQCVIQTPSSSCLSNGANCNSAAACRGTGNNACCSCAATECPLTQNGNGRDWYCTASNNQPSQCPSSAPSRMPSLQPSLSSSPSESSAPSTSSKPSRSSSPSESSAPSTSSKPSASSQPSRSSSPSDSSVPSTSSKPSRSSSPSESSAPSSSSKPSASSRPSSSSSPSASSAPSSSSQPSASSKPSSSSSPSESSAPSSSSEPSASSTSRPSSSSSPSESSAPSSSSQPSQIKKTKAPKVEVKKTKPPKEKCKSPKAKEQRFLRGEELSAQQNKG